MDKILLKENRVHGDIAFPLSAYSMEIPADAGIVLDCHWHEELEFLMVTSGKAIFQIDTDSYEVHAGEGIFVNSGELHAGYSLDSSPCTYKAVVFSTALLQNGSFDLIQTKYLDPLVKNRFSINRHLTGANAWEKELLHRLSIAIGHALYHSPAYELLVKSELYGIFSLIVLNSTPIQTTLGSNTDSFRMERLKNALQFMQDHSSEKLTTMDIAAHLNMSEGHFCRLFKQYFKRTPVEYLNYYRISQAARLLKDTDMKVLEIAMEVGFDNLSYFIGTFKHYMGSTPSKYRKGV